MNLSMTSLLVSICLQVYISHLSSRNLNCAPAQTHTYTHTHTHMHQYPVYRLSFFPFFYPFLPPSENVATLFRATTLATMLMDQFMKQTATDYLMSVVRGPVQQILASTDSCEVRVSRRWGEFFLSVKLIRSNECSSVSLFSDHY